MAKMSKFRRKKYMAVRRLILEPKSRTAKEIAMMCDVSVKFVESVLDDVNNGVKPPATQHGASMYADGCRCRVCKEAHAFRIYLERKKREKAPVDNVPHGTTNGYTNYRCRCDRCKLAQRDYYEAKKIKPKPSPKPVVLLPDFSRKQVDNEGKREAILAALAIKPPLSARQISRLCRVSHSTVTTVKAQVTGVPLKWLDRKLGRLPHSKLEQVAARPEPKVDREIKLPELSWA